MLFCLFTTEITTQFKEKKICIKKFSRITCVKKPCWECYLIYKCFYPLRLFLVLSSVLPTDFSIVVYCKFKVP